MRVESIHLRNFRRFSDLTITGLPESARLIVLAGPNGVGKSSFFDGLQTWYRLAAWNSGHGSKEYNAKVGAEDQSEWYQRVTVNLHGGARAQAVLKESSIYFRTAYRHESDFSLQQLSQPPSPTENGGPARRAVDVDQSVSENYQRLLWQTFSAVFDDETSDEATKAQIRDRVTGQLREALLRVLPDLTLTRVGALGQGHSFEFTKGVSKGFPYVNLSAGEKAIFDLLLDAVVKADYYKDSIWCIDEPELHVGTKAQGRLLRELVSILPEQSQLFLASHSLGLMSEAVKMARENLGEVIFLDFEGHDFDAAVTLQPVEPDRQFWKRMLAVALDDMATLVAPATVVMCEGSGDGFDARCYRTIFSRVLTPRVPLPARGVAWSASDPPRRQRSLLDLGIEPLDLLPVKRACRPNRLSNAIGQEHAGAVVKRLSEFAARHQPAIGHLPQFGDAATAIGGQGEQVGHHRSLEAEDDTGLLNASQGPPSARLGGRVGAHHQESSARSHVAKATGFWTPALVHLCAYAR